MIRQIVVVAEDADQLVDLIVVRCDVGVADWPVVAESVATLRLEVVGTEAKGDAPPMVGAAADHSCAPPSELGAFSLRERLALKLPAADACIELTERTIGCRCSASRRSVRPLEHHRVGGVVPGAARLEEKHVGARLGELIGGHSTACAGADDTNVVRLTLWQWGRGGRAQSHRKSAVEDTRKYDPHGKGTRPVRISFLCVAQGVFPHWN